MPAGTRDRRELRQAMALLRGETQPHRLESRLQRGRVAAMAPEARLQPLLDHDAQRLVQGVVHRDRRGVMVDALGAPVLLDQREVEVP